MLFAMATLSPPLQVVAGIQDRPTTIRTYVIVPNQSELTFQIRHGIRQFVGRFTDFSGEINLDHSSVEQSSINFRVRAASVDTDHAERDEHLRSEDFFHVSRFPKIVFRSTRIRSHAETFEVTGDLMLRGVTKSTIVTVRTPELGSPSRLLRFSVHGSVNRRDHGMIWNRFIDRGGVLLGDQVILAMSLTTRLRESPSAQ
ncbi:MAG TPA: YceI family protein [Thermomicrobiales bacterium]|nr:YceI family protein [Thermomicrobiales bacterium]